MAEQLFSGLVVAVALVLLVRLALGEGGRARVARAWDDATRRIARRAPAARPGAVRKPAVQAQPVAKPLDARDAARIADDAIRRARDRSATRRGNVIAPSAFQDRNRDGDGDGQSGSGRRDRKLH